MTEPQSVQPAVQPPTVTTIMITFDALLTLREVAKVLRASTSHVRNLIAAGELRAVRRNNWIRVRAEDLQMYLDDLKRGRSAADEVRR